MAHAKMICFDDRMQCVNVVVNQMPAVRESQGDRRRNAAHRSPQHSPCNQQPYDVDKTQPIVVEFQMKDRVVALTT